MCEYRLGQRRDEMDQDLRRPFLKGLGLDVRLWIYKSRPERKNIKLKLF